MNNPLNEILDELDFDNKSWDYVEGFLEGMAAALKECSAYQEELINIVDFAKEQYLAVEKTTNHSDKDGIIEE